jgi:hypothetical protein
LDAEAEAWHAISLRAAVDGIQDGDADVVAAKVARAKSRAPLAWKTLSCFTERRMITAAVELDHVLEPLELVLA